MRAIAQAPRPVPSSEEFPMRIGAEPLTKHAFTPFGAVLEEFVPVDPPLTIVLPEGS